VIKDGRRTTERLQEKKLAIGKGNGIGQVKLVSASVRNRKADWEEGKRERRRKNFRKGCKAGLPRMVKRFKTILYGGDGKR